MRPALLLLGLLAAVAGGPEALAAGPPAPAELVKAKLVAEDAAIAPATTVWLDVRLDIKPGWHIYWRNPGDAGLPTSVAWMLPPGFAAGDIEWPLPRRFVTGKIGDYGYTGSADLLAPITVPKQMAAAGGDVPIAATISWLACSDICIPGETKVALTVPVAPSAAPAAAAAPLFAAARRNLPQPAGVETRFAVEGAVYRLFVPERALAGLGDVTATFFPYDGSLLDHAADARLRRTRNGIELLLSKARSASAAKAAPPATLDGVLELRGSDGSVRALAISANPLPAGATAGDAGIAGWRAVLLAFVGGIVLNLMPCVFPILSLKVLSLAGPAHAERGERRRHGLAYAAGVLVSFAALGALLLALRAGGAAVGWGFQLQSPVVVALLAYLLLAMGLSLSGVADFGMALANASGRLSQHASLAGAFGTGVLATVVATPCTAPFMGAALGFALIAPPGIAFAIFIALGTGLAAPFLLATWVPGLHRLLPRPGRWMELVKQILAFGLYGTVAWLVWVLIQEVGPGGSFAVLFGLVLIGFAVWVYGLTRLSPRRARVAGSALAAAGAAAAVVLSAVVAPGAAGPEGIRAEAPDGLAYQPFSPARLAALAAEHKPVFVNLTAAWCLTCLVNERVTLDSAAVRAAFAARGIVPLKGDWTSRNPDITRLLLRFGRSGVPLYLLYDGDGKPQILPQILTEASVLDAVNRL